MKKIITFETIHNTIKAESYFKMLNLPYQIITTPSYITVDCGMSIETEEEHVDFVIKILQSDGLGYKVYDKQ